MAALLLRSAAPLASCISQPAAINTPLRPPRSWRRMCLMGGCSRLFKGECALLAGGRGRAGKALSRRWTGSRAAAAVGAAAAGACHTAAAGAAAGGWAAARRAPLQAARCQTAAEAPHPAVGGAGSGRAAGRLGAAAERRAAAGDAGAPVAAACQAAARSAAAAEWLLAGAPKQASERAAAARRVDVGPARRFCGCRQAACRHQTYFPLILAALPCPKSC